jgi:putative oxidoreductase
MTSNSIYLLMTGRVLLGALYFVSGLLRLKTMAPLTAVLAAKNVPFPGPSLQVATASQIILGAVLMVGIYVEYAVAGLIAFTLVTSFVMIKFWTMAGPERTAGINSWLTNIGVIGGLLLAGATA